MSKPEWFFDDALSRLRWAWAASMREPDAAADPQSCDVSGEESDDPPRWRTSYGENQAGAPVWTNRHAG